MLAGEKGPMPSMIESYFQILPYFKSAFVSLPFHLECGSLPLLQNHIITSGEDSMVNRTKNQIVTLLMRILAAVQNRIKLQKTHKTWSCREQNNE